MPRLTRKSVQGNAAAGREPRLGLPRPNSCGLRSRRAPLHLPPNRASRARELEVLQRGGPEDAADFVARQVFRDALVVTKFLGGGREDEEDMRIVGAVSAYEVADVVH